jgi:hypothetical protein
LHFLEFQSVFNALGLFSIGFQCIRIDLLSFLVNFNESHGFSIATVENRLKTIKNGCSKPKTVKKRFKSLKNGKSQLKQAKINAFELISYCFWFTLIEFQLVFNAF